MSEPKVSFPTGLPGQDVRPSPIDWKKIFSPEPAATLNLKTNPPNPLGADEDDLRAMNGKFPSGGTFGMNGDMTPPLTKMQRGSSSMFGGKHATRQATRYPSYITTKDIKLGENFVIPKGTRIWDENRRLVPTSGIGTNAMVVCPHLTLELPNGKKISFEPTEFDTGGVRSPWGTGTLKGPAMSSMDPSGAISCFGKLGSGGPTTKMSFGGRSITFQGVPFFNNRDGTLGVASAQATGDKPYRFQTLEQALATPARKGWASSLPGGQKLPSTERSPLDRFAGLFVENGMVPGRPQAPRKIAPEALF